MSGTWRPEPGARGGARPAALLAVCLVAGLAAPLAQAGWDATVHLTAQTQRPQPDGVLDPGNRLARLPETAFAAEARLSLALEHDALRLSARPILPLAWEDDGTDRDLRHQGYLSQWQIRLGLAESVSLSLGRERLHWGPAQFRSPASPFYFDNGRDNPSRELSGVDAVKLAYTPDVGHTYTLAWVEDRGHLAAADDAWAQTWLATAERRADDWAAGAVLARAGGQAPFAGLYGQWTLDDSWLVYGEAASATRAQALESPADAALPFQVQAESPRHLTALVGASHTFASGRSLGVELLRDGHGFRQDESRAYFTRAARSPAEATLALVRRPPLLGRHYLQLVWQNSPLEDRGYWRALWSRNLDDDSNELALYLERPLGANASLYGLGVVNTGGGRREFSALTASSLLVGLRLALP